MLWLLTLSRAASDSNAACLAHSHVGFKTFTDYPDENGGSDWGRGAQPAYLAGKIRLPLPAHPLDSPDDQCHPSRGSRDREGWRPNEDHVSNGNDWDTARRHLEYIDKR